MRGSTGGEGRHLPKGRVYEKPSRSPLSHNSTKKIIIRWILEYMRMKGEGRNTGGSSFKREWEQGLGLRIDSECVRPM